MVIKIWVPKIIANSRIFGEIVSFFKEVKIGSMTVKVKPEIKETGDEVKLV